MHTLQINNILGTKVIVSTQYGQNIHTYLGQMLYIIQLVQNFDKIMSHANEIQTLSINSQFHNVMLICFKSHIK